MQILRGILLTVGIGLVAKGIKKAASTCWNTSRRQNLRKNIYFNFTRKGGFVKPLKGDGP